MNEPQTFRSAFNGFHREDVVNHIAYMTSKHEAQVKELREENDTLRTELSDLNNRMDQDAADRERIPGLEQTIADRDAELAALREELEAANQLLNEQAAQMAALREELEEAKEAAAKPVAIEKSANHWDELRAYRRAETVERQARDRVNELYTSANTALRGAGATLGDTNAAFEALAEKFREDLVELMNAIETGRTALTTAADTRICSAVSCSFFSKRQEYAWTDWTWTNAAALYDDAEIACLVYPRKLCIEIADNDELFEDIKDTIEWNFEMMIARMHGGRC